jgi:hypothetical protein
MAISALLSPLTKPVTIIPTALSRISTTNNKYHPVDVMTMLQPNHVLVNRSRTAVWLTFLI